jgi:hypothetical protein
MDKRLRALTLCALLPITTGRQAVAATVSPRPTPSARPNVAAPAIPDPTRLYSAHARRLIQSYLRLRILELREADLDRVRAVIEGKLRVDDLLGPK